MRILIFVLALAWTTPTAAQGLPKSAQTAKAKRWLAVAFIAEAGWLAKMDHRGIYHVLRHRWQSRVKRYPGLTFTRMVQNYVAAFDSRTEKGGRVRWLLSLRSGEAREPAGWPRAASWPKHLVWWRAAQVRAARCVDGGRCPNPYRRARHWGSTTDIPGKCMIKLPNVGTANTFYSVDMACRRNTIRKQRRQ